MDFPTLTSCIMSSIPLVLSGFCGSGLNIMKASESTNSSAGGLKGPTPWRLYAATYKKIR